MNCEGCNKDVGDLKALRAHRKVCEAYKAWNAPWAPTPPKVVQHTYEGRALPRLLA